MASIEEIISKVNRLPELDEDLSVDWCGPSSEAAIAEVEAALDVKIHGSFRKFILLTGGGGLDSLYISPIAVDAPLDGCFRDTQHYRDDWCPHKVPPHLIVIQRDADDNEPMCLDTSREINGENPVVLFYYQSTGKEEPIADSFAAYYENFLSVYFDQFDL